jgi:hypothetical protein
LSLFILFYIPLFLGVLKHNGASIRGAELVAKGHWPSGNLKNFEVTTVLFLMKDGTRKEEWKNKRRVREGKESAWVRCTGMIQPLWLGRTRPGKRRLP